MIWDVSNKVAETRQIRVFHISNMYPSNSSPSYGIFVKKLDDAFQQNGFLISGRSFLFDRKTNIFPKIFQYLNFNFKTLVFGLIQPADFYYCHFPTHSFFSLLFLKMFGKKIVVNYHGSDLMTGGAARKLLNCLICKIANVIVAPSKYLKNQLLVRTKVSEKKIIVFPSCGVDFKKFPLKTHSLEDSYIAGPFCFGFISNLIPGKGVMEFLESFIRLHSNNKNICAVIVGSGPLETSAREIIEKHDLADRVEMLGMLKNEEISPQLDRMNVLVFSSKLPESLGLVPIESLATGTPVIAGMQGAMQEYICKENGLLVDDISCSYQLYEAMNNVMINNHFQPKDVRNSVLAYDQSSVTATFFENLNVKI